MQDKHIRYLKKGIWIYFYLLLFEGALRKWFLPGLSTPLLIVRDPVAFSLLFYGIYWKIWTPNIYIKIGVLLTFFSFIVTLIIGHGNLPVALYGTRILLIHFPLIFLIGHVLGKEDVEKFGRVIVFIGIGMTILVAMQFFSPQSAWVNRGVAGDLSGSGFSGAGGYYRVPGTFSFTNGLTSFYGLMFPFVLFFLFNGKQKVIKKSIIYIAAVSYLIAIPLTISRTVFFQSILTLILFILSPNINSRVLFKVLLGITAVFFIVVLLNNFSFFNDSVAAFKARYDSANRVEGGLEGVFLDRFLGGLVRALNTQNIPFFGYGLGLGSNVGAVLLNARGEFLISEGEWGRIIGERGILIGFAVVILRVIFSISLFIKAFIKSRQGYILSWLLFSSGIILVSQGQWSQPTALGFAVIFAGFILATTKKQTHV